MPFLPLGYTLILADPDGTVVGSWDVDSDLDLPDAEELGDLLPRPTLEG